MAAQRRRGAPGPAEARPRALPATFAAVLLAALSVAAGASAAGSQSIDVEVSTCDAQGQNCETQPPPAEQPPSAEPPSSEVHDVDLGSKGSHVTSSTGEESVTVDLGKGKGKDKGKEPVPAPPAPGTGGKGDGGTKPDRDLPDTSVGAINAPTSTTGGGFGSASPFDFVSEDQALSSFEIPPFLLPIYISAGLAYDVPWNVLAAINSIETDFGRVGACAVSSAGARGWMQFMPATWDAYGVDATGDGEADPCNPVDAIYAAARYLAASGASIDLRASIFAYNHADWYVDDVLGRASVYGSLPSGLVRETGSLAFGHFPVRGSVSYGDDFAAAEAEGHAPTGLYIQPQGDARSVATQDVTVTRVLLGPGLAEGLRRGNEAVTEELASHRPLDDGGAPSAPALPLDGISEAVAGLTGAPQLGRVAAALAGAPLEAARLASAPLDTLGSLAGSKGSRDSSGTAAGDSAEQEGASGAGASTDGSGSAQDGERGERRDDGLPRGFEAVHTPGIGVEVRDAAGNLYRYSGLAGLREGIRVGAKLDAAETIGALRGAPQGDAADRQGEDEGRPMLFETIAAGGARVNPRPLVDGYRLFEAANYYAAIEPFDGNPFVPNESFVATAAGSIEGSQEELARRVLAEPGIDVYDCGRQDIANGIVDSRVLGALLYLRKAGLTLTITSLRCGHGYYTAGGSVSAHSYGAAVDIAAFNGQAVYGNQGPGSLTEQAIKLLMGLEGEAQPAQLISLMSLGGPSFALSDHDDHLHVGYSFSSSLAPGRSDGQAASVQFDAGSPLSLGQPDGGKADQGQERELSERLGAIDNPDVPGEGSSASVPIEGESPDEAARVERLVERERPLELTPTAMGAAPVAIDVPARADGDEAHALATVDGSSRGWAPEQVVVLAHRDGAWALAGPPRDRHGEVVDAPLTDLAAAPGGHGYAVGRKGAVVRLRGQRPPLLLARETKADLYSVAVDGDGDRALATGPSGAVLRIAERRQSIDEVAEGATLGEVAVGSGEAGAGSAAWVAGWRDGGEPLLYERSAGEWSQVPLELGVAPEAAVRLTSVAARGGDVLVGGAIAEQATIGSPAELPFAALRSSSGWTSYCSVDPALAAVRELGEPTARPCDGGLTADGDRRGAASAVALGGGTAIVATGDSLQVLGEDAEGFAPVPLGFGYVSSLSVGAGGHGWLAGPDGQLARVEAGRGGEATRQPRPTLLPVAGDGHTATVAADPSGDRALAISNGNAAVLVDGRWHRGSALGLGVRDLAWPQSQRAWAIDDSGALVELRGGEWSEPAYSWAGPELRRGLMDVSGAGAAAGPELDRLGLQALAFRTVAEGYAVGGGGLVLRYDVMEGWRPERQATAADLADVAAGPGGVVAVGSDGTLLERDGEWAQATEVAELVGGADLTAAGALGGGTMLAAGGGAVLERRPGEAWKLADLPPLGQDVERIAGYRTGGGELRVVALVRQGGAAYLLRGGPAGWEPLEAPDGMAVSDFAARPGTLSLWVSGEQHGRAAVAELDLGSEEPRGGEDEGEGEGKGAPELSLFGAVADNLQPSAPAKGAQE